MSSDPNDLLPTPSVTPSPEGTNPFSSSASTSRVQTSTTSGNAAPPVDPTRPPKEFVKWVNTALQGRLGIIKYGLIPSADKAALIAKIWADPSVESYYQNNYANFANKDPQI